MIMDTEVGLLRWVLSFGRASFGVPFTNRAGPSSDRTNFEEKNQESVTKRRTNQMDTINVFRSPAPRKGQKVAVRAKG